MSRVGILIFVVVTFSVSAFFLARSGLMQQESVEPNTIADVVINFNTAQVTERVWFGSASGGVTGEVTIEALNVPPQLFRGTWAGPTRWQIVAGSNSFVAEMDGKINTYNGVLIMRGKVVDGVNPGANVTAQGQVVAINPHRFVGTIRVIQP